MKVLLVSIDGMRADAIKEMPQVKKMMKESSYTFCEKTVFPSVTLPCHISMFHSVEPNRHGTTTNVYAPQVRPVTGLVERLLNYDKKSAFFYTWEQLRDIASPGTLDCSYFVAGKTNKDGYRVATEKIFEDALKYLKNTDTDFIFLYLGEPDDVGHRYGWMSDKYMDSLARCWDMVEKVQEVLSDDFVIIVTADHGGHDRIHGTEEATDMIIPLFIKGKNIPKNKELKDVSILDVAPTITALFGIKPDTDWEGKSLI